VAAIGVTFSITMFITLLGFMNGLNDLLDGLILNRTPHIKLYNDIKPNANQPIKNAAEYKDKYHFIQSIKSDAIKQAIYNSQAIMNSLQKDTRVAGCTQKLTAQVFFINGTTDITGVLNGVNAPEEIKLFHFNDYVVAGNASDLEKESNTIILGKSLAEKLLVNIGDVIQLSTAKGDRFQLKVVGYFQSGLKDIDMVQSFASIHTVQKVMNKPNSFVTELLKNMRNCIKQTPKISKPLMRNLKQVVQ
jgi:lipoprotein-releasing system permease protein